MDRDRRQRNRSDGSGLHRQRQEQEQRQQEREQQRRQQRGPERKARAKTAAKARAKAKATAKAAEILPTTKSAPCTEGRITSHETVGHDKKVNEVEVENVNAESGKEFVSTLENEINDVNLSQDGCAEREDGLVVIDSGAPANVCP